MDAEVDLFRDYLAANGLRMTQERRAIVEEIFRMQGHFDADALLARFRDAGHNVSRATVYRTLGHLHESGLLRKVVVGHNQALYERRHGRGHHDHLICLDCGTIIEFTSDVIEREQERVCREHRFTEARHVHQVLGYCRDCAGRREAAR